MAKTQNPLPKGINASDLDRPSGWAPSFEMWFTAGFGWCIPTVPISHGGQRTYGVRVSNGGVVRMGMGPHVTERVRVFVRENRKSALQQFMDLKAQGESDALTVRDRVSSRRAQGQVERAAGRRSWRWNV